MLEVDIWQTVLATSEQHCLLQSRVMDDIKKDIVTFLGRDCMILCVGTDQKNGAVTSSNRNNFNCSLKVYKPFACSAQVLCLGFSSLDWDNSCNLKLMPVRKNCDSPVLSKLRLLCKFSINILGT